MCFLDDTDYDRDHVFPEEQLHHIRPWDILRWFNLKVYGTEEPAADTEPQVRSNSVLCWKKMLSYFMPNNHHPWNDITEQGNPTRARDILKLIRAIKKSEARHQGVASQARRPLMETEYRRALVIARTKNDHLVRFGVPALLSIQTALIGRVDDVTQWKKENFKAHNTFPTFAAKARLNWSKNVNEERDAPWQILLGSMDPDFCVLLNVGLWLEVQLDTHLGAMLSPYVLSFSNNNEVPEGGKRANFTAMNNMKAIFTHNDFSANNPGGNLGTHSLRKFASTWARRNGASKDEKDYRGRWKVTRVSDVYDDVELPYPDAKVASLLCVGGPCSYRVKEGANVTDLWIRENVVPRTTATYDNELALITGKAILWLCFSEFSARVPETMLNRILQRYGTIRQLGEGINPIEKQLLVVTGFDAVVNIIEIENVPVAAALGDAGGAANPNVGMANVGIGGPQNLNAATTHQLLQALSAQNAGLQRNMTTFRREREEDRALYLRQFQLLNQNIRRIAVFPFRRLQMLNCHTQMQK